MSGTLQKIWTLTGWVVLSLLTLASVPPANAGAILSPVSVVTSSLGGTTTAHIIDETGLSTMFVSGVTDYDVYTGGNPTHLPLQFLPPTPNAWASGTGFAGKFMVFDLGHTFNILSFALWNQSNTSAVNGFTLSSAMDQNFTTGVTTLGTFTAGIGLNLQVFTFLVAGTGEFVKLQINSGHGANNVNMGEVAFDVTPVPEPAAMTVLGLGLAGLGLIRRKRTLVL